MRKSEMFGGKSLKAADLVDDTGQPSAWILTINGMSTQAFKDDNGGPDKEKRICHFAEIDQTLVLNKTNWELIEKITGKDDDDEWAGHKIELYPTEVQFGGDMVAAIRVRPVGGWPTVKKAVVPGGKKPATPTKSSGMSEGAKAALSQAGVDPDSDEIPF